MLLALYFANASRMAGVKVVDGHWPGLERTSSLLVVYHKTRRLLSCVNILRQEMPGNLGMKGDER